MSKTAYMVVGVPCAGKSWVCEQLKDKICYVHHDAYVGMMGDAYVRAILAALATHDDVLIEAPFSIEDIKRPLESAGVEVKPYFIIESPLVLEARYRQREGKEIPFRHIKRQDTYLTRAMLCNAPYGTSEHILWVLQGALP